jgi:hypothetical protein
LIGERSRGDDAAGSNTCCERSSVRHGGLKGRARPLRASGQGGGQAAADSKFGLRISGDALNALGEMLAATTKSIRIISWLASDSKGRSGSDSDVASEIDGENLCEQ